MELSGHVQILSGASGPWHGQGQKKVIILQNRKFVAWWMLEDRMMNLTYGVATDVLDNLLDRGRLWELGDVPLEWGVPLGPLAVEDGL
jgi:hypothetical protein